MKMIHYRHIKNAIRRGMTHMELFELLCSKYDTDAIRLVNMVYSTAMETKYFRNGIPIDYEYASGKDEKPIVWTAIRVEDYYKKFYVAFDVVKLAEDMIANGIIKNRRLSSAVFDYYNCHLVGKMERTKLRKRDYRIYAYEDEESMMRKATLVMCEYIQRKSKKLQTN